MSAILRSKSYLQFSRSILAMAAGMVLVLFTVISYHRIMINMHSQSDGMMHTSSQATNDCLALCLTAASVSWTHLFAVIQQAFVCALSTLATLFVVAVLIVKAQGTAVQFVQSNRLIQLLLYAKQRWKFKLLCLWSRLLQQGIIAPKLCA